MHTPRCGVVYLLFFHNALCNLKPCYIIIVERPLIRWRIGFAELETPQTSHEVMTLLYNSIRLTIPSISVGCIRLLVRFAITNALQDPLLFGRTSFDTSLKRVETTITPRILKLDSESVKIGRFHCWFGQ